jgi:hypothetical protein
MTRLITFLTIFLLHDFSNASDWVVPDPVTYEWTVKEAQKEIPRLDFKDTSIRDVIAYLGDSMVYPIRLKHDLSKTALDSRVNWNFAKIRWIDVVAKIADTVDADIEIGKRVVTLKKRKPIGKEALPPSP